MATLHILPAPTPCLLDRAISGRQTIRQRITIAPHGGRWMFALDRPFDVPPKRCLRVAITSGAFSRFERRADMRSFRPRM